MDKIQYYLLNKGIITVEDVKRCTVLQLLTMVIERLNLTIEDVVTIETEINTLFNDRLQADIIYFFLKYYSSKEIILLIN